jgi:KilA-N domain
MKDPALMSRRLTSSTMAVSPHVNRSNSRGLQACPDSNSIEFDGIKTSIEMKGTSVTILSAKEGDYISLTDMLRAKDGDFFIADWLRNRSMVEFLGIWETVFNPDFNDGEFAIIKSQAGLNSYKISYRIHMNAIKETLIAAAERISPSSLTLRKHHE